MDMADIQDIQDGNPLKLNPHQIRELFNLIEEFGKAKCLEGNRAGRFATRQEREAKAEADRLLAVIKKKLQYWRVK